MKISFVQLKHLHIVDISLINMETESRPHDMKALYSRSPGIHDKHTAALGVTHDFQDMGVAANKNIRPVFVNQLPCARIIPSWISTNMRHQNFHALTFEKPVQRVFKTQFIIITIAAHAYKRLEFRKGAGKFKPSSEITGVPKLVHRFKKVTESLTEDSVRIRYKSYKHIQFIC